MKNGMEYDESTDRILDFTPEKYAVKCHCCEIGIYPGEECVKYADKYFCSVECVIKQLESDNVIELDFELEEEEHE